MRSISFIIPVFNEEGRLDKTFQALNGVKLPRGLKLEQVIFVDDGSTDKTFEKICEFIATADHSIALVSYKQNRGKGWAIKLGMRESRSDYSLFFDADMSTPLTEIKKLMPFVRKNADVIIGTRKNGHSTVIVHQPLYRELLGKIFTQITRFVLQVNTTDFTCGFKCFSRKASKSIFSKAVVSGWGYDAEIIFLAQKDNFKVHEIPVIWSNERGTKVKLSSAVITTLLELAQIRVTHSVLFRFPALPALSIPIKPKFYISKLLIR